MDTVYMPAFYLGVMEELEKNANLQTSVPGETPEGLLARAKQNKINFPQFINNAQQHNWSVPGVPFANTLIHKFINNNATNPSAIQEKIKGTDDATLLKVINKNPDAFKGVQNTQPSQQAQGEVKVAFDIAGMPVNENILPSLSGQAKWKYVRTKDGLKLSDGNLMYSFGGFPEEYPTEDTRISRGVDDNILDFEKDAISKGTAQIHRASPDNIYMTLANGGENPTFMLQHESGKNWRYSPGKKFLEKLQKIKKNIFPDSKETPQAKEQSYQDSTLLDPSSLFDGAKDQLKQAAALAVGDLLNHYAHPLGEALHHNLPDAVTTLGITNPYHGGGMLDADSLSSMMQSGVQGTKDLAERYVRSSAESPVSSTLRGYALTKGYDSLRDYMDPQRVEERKKDPSARRRHEMLPIAMAAIPTLASMAIMAE